MQKADLIIIGGGPGGYETAAEAAASGKKVILFEKENLGGTCLNRGCIPTKCLCAAAEEIERISGASVFGIEATFTASYSRARERAREVIAELRGGVEGLLSAVTVIRAEASLTADRTVLAGGEEYSAYRIIIATGSRPANLRGIDPSLYCNSDDFLKLEELPARLAIIGGGVIGLEFASIAAAYGTEVTVFEYCKEILPGLDSDIAKRLRTALGKRGIKVITDAAVTAIDKDHIVSYTKKGKGNTLGCDLVIAAVGRRPVLPDGCAEAGIELTEKGFIAVDSDFRTTAEGIYAIGDVNGMCMLAHAASAQGRKVLGCNPDLGVVPSVVFTIPECAFVSNACNDVEYVKLPYGSNGKALASAQEGLLKLGYEPSTRRLVSCAAIGPHAADIIAEATLAIAKGMTADDICRVVHAHPTLSELLSSAAFRIQVSE